MNAELADKGDAVKSWSLEPGENVKMSAAANARATLKKSSKERTPFGGKTVEACFGERGGARLERKDVVVSFAAEKGLKAGTRYEACFLCKASKPFTAESFAGTALGEFRVMHYWKKVCVVLTTPKNSSGAKSALELRLGDAKEGSRLLVGDATLAELPQAPLAEEWTAFLGAPEPESFASVPEKLGSSKGARVKLTNCALDLGKLAGSFKEKDSAFLFNEFECAKAEKVKIGVAADWWLELRLNGEKVFSTWPLGNGNGAFSLSDHVAELPLKAGRNVLAAKVSSGANDWRFVCGNNPDGARSATVSEDEIFAEEPLRDGKILEVKDAEKLDWDEVHAETARVWSPMATTHLPLQPPGDADFVHFEPGMVLRRHRVESFGEEFTNKAVADLAKKLDVFALEFAFGERTPTVPDWRKVSFSLLENRYPVASALLDYPYMLDYKATAFCTKLSSGKTALWVDLDVRNKGASSRSTNVWLRLDFRKESEIPEDEYRTYRWTAAQWLPCERVSYEGETLKLDGKPVGIVFRDDAELSVSKNESFPETAFHPHEDREDLKLRKIDRAFKASFKLEPKDEKSFGLALIVGCENASAADVEELKRARASAKRDALKAFKEVERGAKARLEAPFESWGDIFSALQTQIEQLFVENEKTGELVPTQGGVQYRHFVWVWEAADMMLPLTRAGRFDSVKRAIDSIFSLQDAGFQPEGELQSHAGAVGTTGPRWLNPTGSALTLAATCCLLSRDKAMYEKLLPKMLRAAGWIVGEIKARRRLNPDGSRPAGYGVMPPGRANDGDVGQFISCTDSYLAQGLADFAALLEMKGHPQAAELKKESRQYFSDLRKAAESVRRADGFIDRKLPGATLVEHAFDKIVGAANFVEGGTFSPNEKIFEDYLRFFEEHMASGPFMGVTHEDDKAYVNMPERIWFKIYLRRGEWKKAFAMLRSTLNYSLAPGSWLVAERFSKSEPGYVPFQPNGSGAGRLLDILMNALVFEHLDEKGRTVATLCGALPPLYLKRNGKVALAHLQNAKGELSFDADWLGKGKARIALSGALPEFVRIPDFYAVKKAKGAKRSGAGVFKVAPGAKLAVFDVEEAD